MGSYRQRRTVALAQQKYRESISYAKRRETAVAQAAAVAETTGEKPRYQSFAEYRKSLSYSARRGTNRQLAEESQRQSKLTLGQKQLPTAAALEAARAANRAQVSPSPN